MMGLRRGAVCDSQHVHSMGECGGASLCWVLLRELSLLGLMDILCNSEILEHKNKKK